MTIVRNFCILFLCWVAFSCSLAFAGNGATGSLKQSKLDADRESALDTIAYINQMNCAYAVMKTYHNVLAVEEEYEKISLDRIDVTRIPSFSYDGKAMVNLIKSMLDALGGLKMQEKERQHYQEVLEDQRRRARKDRWMKVVAAVPTALNDAKDVVVKQADKGDAYTVSTQAIVALAGDLIGGPVTAQMNYESMLDELMASSRDFQFNYDKEKEKVVDAANKLLLEAEYDFVKDKNLTREDVITPDELESLVNTLKNGKPARVLVQLNTPDMRSHFRHFAPYWYYLASFAVECKNYEVAIEASDEFFKEYRGLVKVDPMVAQAAIAGITALIATKSGDEAKIRNLLNRIADVNYNNVNPDYSYFCANVLYNILNAPYEALKVLEAANASIEGRFESKLMDYRNIYSTNEMFIAEKELPRDIDLLRIRTLYNDILADRKSEGLAENMLDICANQTASSLEKLFYIGRVRIVDLWKEAKKDVLAIKLKYVRPWGRKNKFLVEIPVSWFLLGEVEPKLSLCKGNKVLGVKSENVAKRKIRKNDAGIGSDVVTLTFVCPGKELRGVDSVRFSFEHKSWPIEIEYRPSLSFDIQSGKGQGGETTYTPVKIKFMGEEKDLLAPPDNVKEAILKDKLEKHTPCLLPFQYGTVDYCTNFLTSVTIDENRNFKVAYTNPTPDKTHIDLKVGYYSKYGARLCNVELDDIAINPYSGDVWNLEWPKDMEGSELPSQVLFQYHVESSVWDKWKNWRTRRNAATASQSEETE